MKTNIQSPSKALILGGVVALVTSFGDASFSPVQAQSKNTWKNLAIAGGVATGYGLLKKKRNLAIAGGLGTAYAYSRYNSKKKAEKRQREAARQRWYQQRYGRHWRNYYKAGA